MTTLSSAKNKPISPHDQSPAAQATTAWLRALARALKAFRLYRADNVVVTQLREEIARLLHEFLDAHGPMDLHFSPSDILLADEPVIRPGSADADGIQSAEEKLPFQFYRDGIRRLTIQPGVPPGEVVTLLDALRITGGGPNTQDDMVTLLWQGNLTRIVVESVPLEQTIYLSVRRSSDDGGGASVTHAQAYAWSPQGAEIRAELGQAAGLQGLHRDTFDDWELPARGAEVPEAWARLQSAIEPARARFNERWREERERDWTDLVPEVMRRLLALDSSGEMFVAMVHASVTWLAAALQRAAWEEAQRALGLMRELDPARDLSDEPTRAALEGLDVDEIVAHLDECEPEDLARFTALVTEIGRPAIALTCAALARAEQVRPRAAASTALCYLCGSDPELLRPYLADSRWTLVRNVVFVLGQIGGPEVAPLLRLAADHPEARVRRQVVQSLGAIPPEMRMPILMPQLDTRDARLLAAALSMMTREKNPRVTRAILDRIEAPDFESRGEDNQRALFNALGEVADDAAVLALEALLYKGGWFARYTLERVAAARTLRRIGTEKAMAVLDAGLRAKSEAVRRACVDAMSTRMAA